MRIIKKTPRNNDGKVLPCQKSYKLINWMLPFLWLAINHAAKRLAFSAQSLVKYLHGRDGQKKQFSKLTVGIVNGWIDIKFKPQSQRPEVLKFVEAGTCWPSSKGRTTMFDLYLELKEQILNVLMNI